MRACIVSEVAEEIHKDNYGKFLIDEDCVLVSPLLKGMAGPVIVASRATIGSAKLQCSKNLSTKPKVQIFRDYI